MIKKIVSDKCELNNYIIIETIVFFQRIEPTYETDDSLRFLIVVATPLVKGAEIMILRMGFKLSV